MLVPCFEARQNEEFVILTIRVPYIKISDAEIDIYEKDFKFHCHPYFLWLQFSGQVIENGSEKAQYDVETGNIIVHVPKKIKHEQFTNLEMLTSLLGNKKEIDLRSVGQQPSIEVLSSTTTANKEDENKEEFDLLEGIGQSYGQSEEGAGICEEDIFTVEKKTLQWTTTDSSTLITSDEKKKEKKVIASQPCVGQFITGLTCYGFANQHSGVFTKLQEEIPSIIDCPDPDHLTKEERRIARLAHEQTSFDPNYYLADLMENDRVSDLLKFVQSKEEIAFTDREKDILKDLPNKEYSDTERSLLFGLVDLLFAFSYNNRITEGENTVESAWTICKISATLSWLDEFQNLYDVIYSCYRRSLCYPLYRHWNLTEQIFKDTLKIFEKGKQRILKCLLSLRQLLNESEPYYILNNLYISDYCIWLQRVKDNVLSSLIDELNKIVIDKSCVGFELPELEEAAYLVLQEEEEEEREGEGESEEATTCSSDYSDSDDEEKGEGEEEEKGEERGEGGREDREEEEREDRGEETSSDDSDRKVKEKKEGGKKESFNNDEEENECSMHNLMNQLTINEPEMTIKLPMSSHATVKTSLIEEL